MIPVIFLIKKQIDTLKSKHTTAVLKKTIENDVLKRNGTPEQAAQVIAEYEKRFGAIQGNDVSAPNPTQGNVNNEALSGSKPVTGSETPIDYKSYDYERLQKEVDTLDRAWKNLENARIEGTLNEKDKEALATTESQLSAARKELRSRPEFKASLNTPLPFGPNKPPNGNGAPKPNPVTGNNVWSVDTVNTGTPNGIVYTENTGNPWSDVVKTYKDILSGEISTDIPPSEIPEVQLAGSGAPEAQKGTETAQPKKQRTLQESRNAVLSKLNPTPGSHFDENYHVIIDDPIKYTKALENDLKAIDEKLTNRSKLQVTEVQELSKRRTWIRNFLERAKETAIRAGEKVVEVGRRVSKK